MNRVVRAIAMLGIAAGTVGAAETDALARGFAGPPPESRPWVYWFWLNSNITSNGITATSGRASWEQLQ